MTSQLLATKPSSFSEGHWKFFPMKWTEDSEDQKVFISIWSPQWKLQTDSSILKLITALMLLTDCMYKEPLVDYTAANLRIPTYHTISPRIFWTDPLLSLFHLLKANVTTALAECHCVKLLALSSLWMSIPMVTLQILMVTSFQHNKLNIRCLSHLSSSSINIVSYWNFSNYWNHAAIKEKIHNKKAGQRKP